jgi:hypothetical protein
MSKSIVELVSEQGTLEIFTFDSIKLLIDHNWDLIG